MDRKDNKGDCRPSLPLGTFDFFLVGTGNEERMEFWFWLTLAGMDWRGAMG